MERVITVKEYNKKLENYVKDMKTAAIMTVRNPQRMRHWIETMLHFTQYGFLNQMKLHCVYKNPTYIKTYKGWKDLGVTVNHGEHGCKLCRPIIVHGIEKDGKFVSLGNLTQQEKEEIKQNRVPLVKRFTGKYTYFTAFDISQTDATEEVLAKLAGSNEKPKINTIKVLQNYASSTSTNLDDLSMEVVKDVFTKEEIKACPDIDYVMAATQLGLLHYLGENTKYLQFKEAKVFSDENYFAMSKEIYEKIKMVIKEINPFLNN